ncbi:MAG TPA: DUF3488 and transglutaminase-like domain-containing protein [Acidimicrobiales bacterium]|nr:DUF3488 and transglutaminase-like domain-containing protein [Acidimicrobiales bacterium]
MTPGRMPGGGASGYAAAAPTLALTVLTIVTVAGMSRLFRGGNWITPVVACALVTHLLLWLARGPHRRGRAIPLPLAVLLTAIATYCVLAWTVVPDSTFFALPLARTATTMGHDFAQARQVFSHVQAPTLAVPGFVLAAGVGAWVVAVLADWAAFRLHATLEAVVPALATLIFVSLLANDHGAVAWSGIFAAAVVLFVAVHDASSRWRTRARFTGGSGPRTLLTGAGMALAGLVAVSGALIGPRVPGARANAVISVHQAGNGLSKRTTISPLVDIRDRLVNESNIQLFTVNAPRQAYWRLTSLDTFDGNIWSSDEPYASVGSQLPVSPPSFYGGPFPQSYVISNLGSIWLPAAYLPTRITGTSGVSWDANSDSLISRAATSDGESYRVDSRQPQLSAAQLRTATIGPPAVSRADLAKFTALPGGIPSAVVKLAQQVTAGAATPYDKAMALQKYLRTHYTYSLQVPPGHSDSALYQFLFVDKRGYCEQFAGSYAVMARAIGLPTRVAVGFTPGVAQSDGSYTVTGADAHAWPEVWLGQFGWVAFEPTPGRGNPAATSYTGIPAQQAAAPTGAPSVTPATTPAPTPSIRPPSQLSTNAGPKPAASHTGREAGFVALVALAVVLGLACLWAATVPLVQTGRRRARRRQARSETDLVLTSWNEAAERLAATGLARRPGETLQEHARRAAADPRLGGKVGATFEALATQATVAAYGLPELSLGGSTLAGARAAQVERAVLDAAGTWRRLGWNLDPRPRRAVSRA